MTVKDQNSYGATTTASPAPTNVQVIAPATLEPGYTFDAMYEGATFTVTVPNGGVIKGQRFIVPFTPPAVANAVAVAIPESSVARDTKISANNGRGKTIPTGIWRDGLCSCCKFGPFHPHFLCALCFKPFMVGQLLTRMKMTWTGQRTPAASMADRRWKDTFRNIAMLTIAFYGVMIYVAPTATTTDIDEIKIAEDGSVSETLTFKDLSDSDKVKYYIQQIVSAIFGFFIFYLMIQLRATLRHVYSIPEESCLCLYQLGLGRPREGVCGNCSSNSNKLCSAGVPIGWEDICCSIWCQLCILGQMARHTVDYEEKGAVWCNDVGVADWDEEEAFEGVEAGSVGEGSVLVV